LHQHQVSDGEQLQFFSPGLIMEKYPLWVS
jgi:hypothetical protein